MSSAVKIEKLVHGGQALGTLADGRRVLVWNALPGETVSVQLQKNKKSYAEGVAEVIQTSSPERIEPVDEAFLSTSPWQIMTFAAENKYKRDILQETFEREHVAVPSTIEFVGGGEQTAYGYRNKMEYSFWGDEQGLHLALFNRGTHGKQIVPGSSLAMPAIDVAANQILDVLNDAGIRGSQLKTIVIRADQQGQTVAALYVKDPAFPELAGLGAIGKGIVVFFSNPKSPASVITSELYIYGDITLTDSVLSTSITYDVTSFFQVHVPVFERALKDIQTAVGNTSVIDFYAGVGTIGIPLHAKCLVESDYHNVKMAQQNAGHRKLQIVHATAESALEYIPSEGALVVDPPRAGLHHDVINVLHIIQPPIIAYLSCNPITQARDIALLQDIYELKSLTGYNFFPRTPHIESLAILTRK